MSSLWPELPLLPVVLALPSGGPFLDDGLIKERVHDRAVRKELNGVLAQLSTLIGFCHRHSNVVLEDMLKLIDLTASERIEKAILAGAPQPSVEDLRPASDEIIRAVQLAKARPVLSNIGNVAVQFECFVRQFEPRRASRVAYVSLLGSLEVDIGGIAARLRDRSLGSSSQQGQLHAIAHAMTSALGNAGRIGSAPAPQGFEESALLVKFNAQVAVVSILRGDEAYYAQSVQGMYNNFERMTPQRFRDARTLEQTGAQAQASLAIDSKTKFEPTRRTFNARTLDD